MLKELNDEQKEGLAMLQAQVNDRWDSQKQLGLRLDIEVNNMQNQITAINQETSDRIDKCEVKISEFVAKLNLYHNDTIKFRVDIDKSFQNCTEEIFDRLHADESRLQDLEIKHLNFIELKDKFHEFQYEIQPTLELAAKNGKTSLFVERYLPLLIHLQISEHIFAIL